MALAMRSFTSQPQPSRQQKFHFRQLVTSFASRPRPSAAPPWHSVRGLRDTPFRGILTATPLSRFAH